MTAASIRARSTSPTDSMTKLPTSVILDVPYTLYVFTLLILGGTRAKKKLMKLIMAMMMVSIATASKVTSTVLLPIWQTYHYHLRHYDNTVHCKAQVLCDRFQSPPLRILCIIFTSFLYNWLDGNVSILFGASFASALQFHEIFKQLNSLHSSILSLLDILSIFMLAGADALGKLIFPYCHNLLFGRFFYRIREFISNLKIVLLGKLS